MTHAYETLSIETPRPHVLQVTLNRPAVRNAINTQMGRDLLALWSGLIVDPGDVRAVVLTGAGSVFCAGGDLKERNGMSEADWRAQHEIFERGYWALLDCPVPVIAAVNGHAYGGGCEMLLACDFAYAVPAARFALTEVTLGIMPGAGGTQLLPRAVGERRA
jgi:enoyl-CoA hydratase/carnithine racemase